MIPKQLPNEQEIVDRAKAGDDAAFTILITHYDKYIYNIACKYADLEPDREEVVQEAVLKVWQNIKKFKGDSKFSTWLYVVVRNDSARCLTTRHKIPSHPYNTKSIYNDEHDDHQEQDESFMNNILNENYSDDNSPESNLRAERLADAIFKFASELNTDLYETWWLREVELMTYDEIAIYTDNPIGTIKSRLFNAREILNTKLVDYLGGDSGRFELSQ